MRETLKMWYRILEKKRAYSTFLIKNIGYYGVYKRIEHMARNSHLFNRVLLEIQNDCAGVLPQNIHKTSNATVNFFKGIWYTRILPSFLSMVK
jgi:hypothetical protein